MEQTDLAALEMQYVAAERRLIFIGLEEVLVQGQVNVTGTFRQIISDLCSDRRNIVVVLSDLTPDQLENMLSDVPVALVAENGGFVRTPDGQWQTLGDLNLLWKKEVTTALHRLAGQYAGTSIHEKNFSVAWNYGEGTRLLTDSERKQLGAALRMLSTRLNVQQHDSGHTLEFFTPAVSRGKFAGWWITSQGQADFILAIGSKADEDLFASIGKGYSTIRVGGASNSHARYFISSQLGIEGLLKILVGKDDSKK
jgi:trehalose 6-phosphate synthase/phosphatase